MNRYTKLAALACAATLALGAAPAGASTGMSPGTLGADISWPQCSGSDTATPQGVTFAIVGVNGGKPMETNPCYAAQMSWESATLGPNPGGYPVQVYLNTADPGNTVPDWPSTGWSAAYGTCILVKSRGQMTGADSQACAYLYGVRAAGYAQDAMKGVSPAPGDVWLDVETGNTWQAHTLQDLNEAVLDGMVDTLHGYGYTVGAYSTHYQWNKILGGLDPYSQSDLGGLMEWIPTGTSGVGYSECSDTKYYPPFTTGALEYLQYTTTYDYDVACPTNTL